MSSQLVTRDLDASLTVADALVQFADEQLLILLDSAAHIRRRDARYSILTADPTDTVRLESATYGSDPFKTLRQWESRIPRTDTDLPFCGGIAGLMAYELGEAFEAVPRPARDNFHTPVLIAGFFDWAIVWDHIDRTVRLCVINPADADRKSEKSANTQRVDWVLRKLETTTTPISTPRRATNTKFQAAFGHALPSAPHVQSDFSRDEYIAATGKVIEYIRAGDIFQANLSQQLTASWSASAVDLYLSVRQQNPAPFCGLLQTDDFAVVSASPERFLKVTEGRYVETRPIKGTRRRLKSPIADLFTSNELYASEKDRAENVMIVDLLRNDISRVCRPGSVKVTGLCEIEIFETVQHLVSTVVGELQSDCDIWDLCAATIPGGSITGAPKIRAMEIIAELEPVVRGAYCGNLFYLGPNGHFDSSILIRTFTLKNEIVQFPVGGGIVADSDPADEYAETLHKAAGMLKTLTGNL